MKILLDSDALFALFIPTDAHHKKARKLFEASKRRGDSFYMLQNIIGETATVISYKRDQQTSISFVTRVDQLGAARIKLDEVLEEQAWKIFLVQTKKGTSFMDCANLAAARHYKMDKIFSFDLFYPKELLI